MRVEAATIDANPASCSWFGKKVPDPPHRMNLDSRTRIQQSAPQVMHMNRNRIRFEFIIDSVELLLEHSFGHHSSQAPHQMFKNRKLATRERQGGGCNSHITSDGIENDIPGAQDRS